MNYFLKTFSRIFKGNTATGRGNDVEDSEGEKHLPVDSEIWLPGFGKYWLWRG